MQLDVDEEGAVLVLLHRRRLRRRLEEQPALLLRLPRTGERPWRIRTWLPPAQNAQRKIQERAAAGADKDQTEKHAAQNQRSTVPGALDLLLFLLDGPIVLEIIVVAVVVVV